MPHLETGASSPIAEQPTRASSSGLRAALVVALLYSFLVGVKLLEDGVKGLGSDTAGGLFDGITNPFAALFVGVLATVLVQSSSVTTATIVGLVAAGQLPIEVAVPMIMGANIGTSVTNTIVSLGSPRRSETFRLAFAAATMHDFFNILTVAILLPLELATGFLLSTASRIADFLPAGSDATFNSPIKSIVAWGADLVERFIARIIGDPTVLAASLIIVGIAVIFVTLTYITRNMRVLIAERIEKSMNAALGNSAATAMMVGILVTVLVQSSSITTSILVPLVGSGILVLRNAYPITMGANIGTTITALLAALATGTVEGMTIALVHVLFNVAGIIILYPVRRVRYVPVHLAEGLASVAMTRRWLAVTYVVTVFIVVPAVGIVTLS
jgi:sodium-dependent phosphate cotransporter